MICLVARACPKEIMKKIDSLSCILAHFESCLSCSLQYTYFEKMGRFSYLRKMVQQSDVFSRFYRYDVIVLTLSDYKCTNMCFYTYIRLCVVMQLVHSVAAINVVTSAGAICTGFLSRVHLVSAHA